MSELKLHHDQPAPAAGLFDIFDNRSRLICAAARKQLLQRRHKVRDARAFRGPSKGSYDRH